MVDEFFHKSADNLTDGQLLELSLRDEDAFYWLMKRYEPKLKRYIKRITTISREDSEDLLQEIFVKIYRNLNGFDPDQKFSSWVYRIARNEIIGYHRKQKRRAPLMAVGVNATDDSGLDVFLSDTLDVQEIYLSLENRRKVRVALSKLPPKYGEILVLRYFEEMSYREIGEILRKPMGSVATLINRAKAKFKKIARRHQLDGL